SDTGEVVYHIAYSLPPTKLEGGGRLAAPWPDLTLPVVSSTWVCEVPHDMRLITPLPNETDRTWQQRLLGILGIGELNWFQDSNLPRWQSVRIPAPAQLPLEIRLVSTSHRTTQCLWILAASLIASHFCVQRWPTATGLMAGVAAPLSVLLLGGWAFYVAAVSARNWLGIFVTALSLTLSSVSGQVPRPRSVATTGVLVFLVVGCLFAAASRAQGQESAVAAPDLESLLIPVDEEGRETGERHYVTPRLLRDLTQRRDARQARGAWI